MTKTLGAALLVAAFAVVQGLALYVLTDIKADVREIRDAWGGVVERVGKIEGRLGMADAAGPSRRTCGHSQPASTF